MTFKDHFSRQAADYAKFRPRYPREIFAYVGSIAPSRQLAWDCGTGNGQAAVGLALVFDRVIATDASEKQIANAEPHKRVEYRIAPAENSGLKSETVDLIMVAQALHWFDLDRFYAEARRVLKPDGALTASAYNLLQIEPAIDEIVNRYYYEVVGPFWPPERKLVENFADLPFPFHEIDPPKFEMTAQWNLDHLLGYLRTWSSTQRFIAANERDPLEEIAEELRAAWGDAKQTRYVGWPLTLRIGIGRHRKRHLTCLAWHTALSRIMKLKIISVMMAFCLASSGAVLAAGARTYQVTGTVVAATGSMVTVQKETEKWEIDIDPATTKGFGDLKVGSTITVTYVMSATKLETSATAAETTPAVPSPTPIP